MFTGNQIATSLQADIGLRPDIRYLPGGSADYAHHDFVAQSARTKGFSAAGRMLKAFLFGAVGLFARKSTAGTPTGAGTGFRSRSEGYAVVDDQRRAEALPASIPKAA